MNLMQEEEKEPKDGKLEQIWKEIGRKRKKNGR